MTTPRALRLITVAVCVLWFLAVLAWLIYAAIFEVTPIHD